MTETVTWLHISDTHFCEKKYGSDSKEIIDKFFEDLKWMEKKYNLYPDLIFFTGDLAFGHIGDSSGLSLKDQYEEVRDFLEKIQKIFPRVQRSNIFIVPGNHDVNRTQIMPEQIFWLNDLRNDKTKDGSKTINEIIKNNTRQWNWYMERLNDYRFFLEDSNYKHLLEDPDRLMYSIIRDINGFKIGIAGLNSAWSSCGDEDKAKLWLGTFQISETSNKLKDTNISIAISHHPPNWFTDLEDQPIDKKIERNFHFYLHGHEHQGWIKVINKHTRIASGALYSGSEMGNVYNFVKLYPSDNRGNVFLRTFNGDRWTHHPVGDANNDGIWPLNNLNINIDNPEISVVLDKELKTSSSPSDSLYNALKVSMQVPQLKNYVGRHSDISDLYKLLENNLIIIEGIAGIGKTYLATKFAEEISNEYEVGWYGDLSESTSIGSVMCQIAIFLLEKGRPTMYNSIETLGYNFDNLINIFKQELANSKFAFFFDNYHKTLSKLDPLMKKLLDIQSSKIILVTRVNPTFYNILDEIENRIGLKTINRWSYEESKEMLKSRGIVVSEESTLKEIHNRLQGYPQYLNLFCILALKSEPKELLEKLPNAEKASHDYLEAEVYKSLNSNEKKLIKISSIYRIPENIEAFYINPDLQDVEEILEGLISKFLINKGGEDKYSVHEIISDYCLKDVKKKRILRDYHRYAAKYYELKDKSPESLLEASYHYIEAGDNDKSANIIINKASILVRKGFWEEIEKPLKNAIDTLSKHRDNVKANKAIGHAHCVLADFYSERGDLDLSLKHLNLSEKALMGKGDKYNYYELKSAYGHLYSNMGEIDNCEKCYQRCLELSEGNNYNKAVARGNLGHVYFQKGNYEKALELHLESKVAFENLKDQTNAAVACQNIAESYLHLENYDNAYFYVKDAIKIFRDIEQNYYLNRAIFTYAIIYLNDPHKKEKLDASIQCLSKVLEAFSKMGYIRGEARVYLYIGLVYDRLNNIDCSIKYYQKAKECFEKIDFCNFSTDDKIFLAITLMYLNDFDRTESIINDTLELVSDGNILSPILNLLLAVCSLCKNQELQTVRIIENVIKYCALKSCKCGNFDFFVLYSLIEKQDNKMMNLIEDIISFFLNKTKHPKIRFEHMNIEKDQFDNYAEVFHPFIGHKTITKNDESLKIIISKLKNTDEEIDIDVDEVLGIERNTALMILGYLYKKGFIKVSELSVNTLKIGLSQSAKSKLTN